MDFVDVSKIPVDEKIEESNNKGYQVQGIKDKNAIKVIQVGEFKDMCDVRITSFKFKEYECELISCLLDDKMVKSGELNILKILISNSGVVGRLLLKFASHDEIKIDEELSGEFNIEFYCEKGMAHIGKLDKFPGRDDLIPSFVKYMLDDDVLACLKSV